MKEQRLPTIDYLNECFTLDAEAGRLFFKIRPRSHFTSARGYGTHKGRINEGDEVVGKQGTMLIRYCGKSICTAIHRVIYKMATGEEPYRVMHINGDFEDNRIENLQAL